MRIPDAVLDGPVTGTNLVPGRLRDQLAETPTLLAFLRHVGRLFCQVTVADLRTESRAFLRRD